MEAEGPGHRYGPAGEGGSDPGAAERPDKWAGNIYCTGSAAFRIKLQSFHSLCVIESEGKLLLRPCLFLQAPSESVIGQESAGEREGNSAILCMEVTKLTTALQEYQDMVQVRYLH